MICNLDLVQLKELQNVADMDLFHCGKAIQKARNLQKKITQAIESSNQSDKNEVLRKIYTENGDDITIPTSHRKYLSAEQLAIADMRLNTFSEIFNPLLEQAVRIYDEKTAEGKVEQKKKNYEHQKSKFSCDCGGYFTIRNKSAHVKSEKHLKFVVALPAGVECVFNVFDETSGANRKGKKNLSGGGIYFSDM